ncbi:MAG: hypothetical protein Q9201_004951 [Fulgogasparrea decipioides]
MTLWTGENDPHDWEENLVWHSELNFKGSPLSYQGVLDVANAHYNWLKTQDKYLTKRGCGLVAVFWDPSTERTYASSIPRGMRSSVMNFEASKKGAAPVWWAQAGLVNRRFHAEDGAFYNWETSTDANTVDGRYPSGSIVAVWGTFDRDKTSHEVSSCIGPRIPSCKDVARALGVGFRGNLPQAAPQGNIPQTTQQPVSEDSGDEIDKDWTEEDNKLMALCNTGGHRKRAAMHGKGLLQRDTSTCNPFPFPSVVSASTVTDTFPNSDYDLSTGVVATNVELSGLVTIGSITTSPTTTGPTATSMITAAPGANPTCSIRNQDPDRGINSGFCICDQTVTLPLLSISTVVEEDESCHYTTMPTTPQITIKPTVGPAMTDTKHCQVCTPVVKWEEQSCTSLPGCIVQTGAVTVQAGSSPVHVGTLTGSELYNSVSSALEKLCPSATQTDSLTTCETDTVRIKNIPYMDGEKAYDDGELVVSVESSQYNLTSLRNAMIKTAALSAQNLPLVRTATTSRASLVSRKGATKASSGCYLAFLPEAIMSPRLPQTTRHGATR